MSETNALSTRSKQEVDREGTRPGPVFRPDVDILEGPDEFVIYADLPGVDDQSVDVRFERGTLTLDARLASRAEAGWSPLYAEYREGSFHREFRVSDDIDADAVTGRMHDGVLELRLPKAAERRPRAIPVQGG